MPESTIRGFAGRLECRYHENKNPRAPLALILHPDPYGLGASNDKTVATMYQTFGMMGFKVLRFRYQREEDAQPAVSFEDALSDVSACLDWFQARHPYASYCWVAGFSQGAWLGMQLLMRRPEIVSFISVAAPAHNRDFSFLAPCPVSGLFVHAERDAIVPKEFVLSLVRTLSGQRNIRVKLNVVKGADHFFRQHLQELSQMIKDYVYDFHQNDGLLLDMPLMGLTEGLSPTVHTAVG